MNALVVAIIDAVLCQFRRIRQAALIAGACIALAVAMSTVAMASQTDINIPPQGMDSALRSLAKQADIQIVFSSKQVGYMLTKGVYGRYSAMEALRILLKDTGLEFEFTDGSMVAVGRPSTRSAPYDIVVGAPKTTHSEQARD